jgi:hypothetical protein
MTLGSAGWRWPLASWVPPWHPVVRPWLLRRLPAVRLLPLR